MLLLLNSILTPFKLFFMELILESDILFIDIEKYKKFEGFMINGASIVDKYTTNEKHKGEYQLILKKTVNNTQELNESAKSLNSIALLINPLMTYAIGYPINVSKKEFYGKNINLVVKNKVESWTTNYDQVSQILQTREHPHGISGIGTIGDIITRSASEYAPLFELVKVIDGYKHLDNLTKKLIRYHTLAHSHEFDVRYILLGKALEIAELLLPIPKDRKKSFGLLPPEIKDEFNDRNILWLYNMSNNRMETRHAVNLASKDSLHSWMTDDEYFYFMYLSDLLITYIVRTKMNLEPMIITAQ